MKVKMRGRIFGMLIIVLILCVGVMAAFMWGGRRDAGMGEASFHYVALGDSIPNGYSVSEEQDMEGYPRILTEELREVKGDSVSFSEYTKNGITADGLCERYLSDVKVQEEIKNADLITVTAGANDILKRCRELYREIFGEEAEVQDMETVFSAFQKRMAKNPELAAKAAEIMKGWRWEEFEEDWKRMMDSIQKNRKKSCRVIVTTLYNPVGEKEGFRMLNLYIEQQIGRVNDVIMEYQEVYGYQAADIREAGMEEHLQADGLHPDGDGQRIIAGRVWSLFMKERL